MLFRKICYYINNMIEKPTSAMPLSRQVRYFKESRENWKERALDKQEQLRFFAQKNSDLEQSRDKWKTEALSGRQEIKELKKEIENLKKKINQLKKLP
jgi:chromosome segregation ATPase